MNYIITNGKEGFLLIGPDKRIILTEKSIKRLKKICRIVQIKPELKINYLKGA